MIVTDLEWHSGSGLFTGFAESVRKTRYRFGVRPRGEIVWIDRKLIEASGVYWLHLRNGPQAVRSAVRAAVRSAVRRRAA